MSTEQENFSTALYEAVLNRMNITWEPDEKTQKNVRNAMEEAMSYLRSVAGNNALSFEEGEKRSLFITCAWYFVENKRAEFIQEYTGELVMLRLTEGFGCGKEATDEV